MKEEEGRERAESVQQSVQAALADPHKSGLIQECVRAVYLLTKALEDAVPSEAVAAILITCLVKYSRGNGLTASLINELLTRTFEVLDIIETRKAASAEAAS